MPTGCPAAFGYDEITSGRSGLSWVMHLSTLMSASLKIPHPTPAHTAACGHSGTYRNTANRQEKTKFAHFCFYHTKVDEGRDAGRAVH